LSAASAFVASFPRTGYPLPGTSNPLGAIALVIQSVFLFPSVDMGRYLLVNERFRLDEHEWDFSLTTVTLALLVAGAVSLWRGFRTRERSRRAVLLTVALVCVLLVPIAVNVYTPGWNAFLKSVPIVRNSSSLVRWFVTYVPVFTVLAALALDRVAPDPTKRMRIAVAAGLLVLATHVLRDRDYYATQPYSSTRIASAFDDLRRTGRVPPIERCSLELAPDGTPLRPPDRNDGLVDGTSPIECYEPIFGYQLEWFPRGTLHAGLAREADAGTYNFKNPAGYLFPAENGLEPGGHFRVGQERELAALLDYRPYPFEKSARQRAAEVVNLVALAAVAVFLLVCTVLEVRARRAGPERRSPA
jgi:hypothetical protein